MKNFLLTVILFTMGATNSLRAQTFTALHSFASTVEILGLGGYPFAGLVQGGDGRLYGTTDAGGADGYGLVFAVNADGTAFTPLYSFTNGNDGGNPNSTLIQGSDRRLYGTTAQGGDGHGVVFAVNTNGTGFATIYAFRGNNDGQIPCGVTQGSDGRLYGTTVYAVTGGPNSPAGSVFAVKTDGTGFTTLYTFTNTSGSFPEEGVIQASDGRLYGAATQDQLIATANGTVFGVNADGTNFMIVHNIGGSDNGSYNPALQGNVDPSFCYGGLIQGRDGRLYGTTTVGGSAKVGSIFATNLDGTNFTTLYSFTGGADGGTPSASLVQGSDGRLYGAASGGGAYNHGDLFAVNTDGTGFTTLYSFTNGADGGAPLAGLIQGSDGRFYGTASTGGANSDGTIYAFGLPPTFTTNPASQTVNAGQTAVFTAVASGSSAYQWTFNGAAISGATSATLTLTNVTAASAGVYAATAIGAGGSATSISATLTVDTAPTFAVSPVSVTIASGRSAAFSVSASGRPTPTYQWYLNNVMISGATDPILLVPAADSSRAGNYTCVATNSIGSTTSSAATLTVDSTGTPGYLINISARGNVGVLPGDAGPGILFGGVGLSGSGTKSLLVRGIGPGLATYFPALFTPSQVVTDPQLSLLTTTASATPVAQNDNWGGGSTLTNAFNQTGAFSLQANSLDAALLTTLPVANYNIQVTTTGAGSAAGTGMVEVYDADTGTPTAHITNLSARDYVGTGNHILIGGFAIRGTDYETLLIRSLGPSLTQSGLTNVLAQPVVTIISGQTVIYSNTGWNGDPALASAMTNVAGNSPGPTSQDSALLVSLPPGNYTVEVTGATGATGQATIEFYDVP